MVKWRLQQLGCRGQFYSHVMINWCALFWSYKQTSMAELEFRRKRSHARRFCSHCSCYVSKSTWLNHRSHRAESAVSTTGEQSKVSRWLNYSRLWLSRYCTVTNSLVFLMCMIYCFHVYAYYIQKISHQYPCIFTATRGELLFQWLWFLWLTSGEWKPRLWNGVEW